ncbi:dUTP diphosphatase [Bacillus zanthoxyli]|nr:dUTP diphosphatase [Bacillus zanthoxyli]
MNLTKLFDMQRVLDQRIMDKHPELKGQDNLEWKVLALQVELGECANEHRGFKKWSNDQEPRTAWKQPSYGGGYIERNLLLEEYVDCLHFILSIGLDLEDEETLRITVYEQGNVIGKFLRIYELISEFSSNEGHGFRVLTYQLILGQFLGLGKLFGFTWEQIEQAYLDKNKVNHERQESGY